MGAVSQTEGLVVAEGRKLVRRRARWSAGRQVGAEEGEAAGLCWSRGKSAFSKQTPPHSYLT